MTFGLVLASGRFDAAPVDVTAAWDEFRAIRNVRVILGTEHMGGIHDDAFKAKGWEFYRGGELVLSWDAGTFERAWPGAGHLDPIGTMFTRGTNATARTPLASIALRHIETRRVIHFHLSHMPAHIQDGDRFRPAAVRPATAWVTALAAWGRRVRRINRKHAQISAADWNVDMHRAHWRSVVSTALGMKCARPVTAAGDMGPRLISWAFVKRLTVTNTAVLRKSPGSDHRPVLFRLTIKEK